jgi:predicted small lipoprotein YifL
MFSTPTRRLTAAVIALAILSFTGCAKKPIQPPPSGLQGASDASAALKENHRGVRYHLEAARDALQ